MTCQRWSAAGPVLALSGCPCCRTPWPVPQPPTVVGWAGSAGLGWTWPVLAGSAPSLRIGCLLHRRPGGGRAVARAEPEKRGSLSSFPRVSRARPVTSFSGQQAEPHSGSTRGWRSRLGLVCCLFGLGLRATASPVWPQGQETGTSKLPYSRKWSQWQAVWMRVEVSVGEHGRRVTRCSSGSAPQ